MKAETKTRSPHAWKITVESDWATTVGAAALLIVCGLLLAREIDHFIWGHLRRPVPIYRGFWSIWSKVFEAIAAIYGFIFAFTFTNNSVKIACLLMGIELSSFVLLSCFHTPPAALHIAAVGGSVVRQIALAIFCVALAQWLRSVIRRDRQSELSGGEN